jgi:hypothetical protein
MCEISRLAEELSASQGGLCYTDAEGEWVSAWENIRGIMLRDFSMCYGSSIFNFSKFHQNWEYLERVVPRILAYVCFRRRAVGFRHETWVLSQVSPCEIYRARSGVGAITRIFSMWLDFALSV